MFSEKITCHYLTLGLRCWAPQVVLEVKNLPANAGDLREGFDPWVEKTPRMKQQPIPVFLPGKVHGQRNLEGYSLWGCKELAMIERVHEHTYTHTRNYFSHFTDEETEEVQLGKVTCSRKHSRKIRIRP